VPCKRPSRPEHRWPLRDFLCWFTVVKCYVVNFFNRKYDPFSLGQAGRARRAEGVRGDHRAGRRGGDLLPPAPPAEGHLDARPPPPAPARDSVPPGTILFLGAHEIFATMNPCGRYFREDLGPDNIPGGPGTARAGSTSTCGRGRPRPGSTGPRAWPAPAGDTMRARCNTACWVFEACCMPLRTSDLYVDAYMNF
jgi:hypothetical protein